MTEQQAEETTTVYARVNWTNHYTQTTVDKGDPVQVKVADVDRLVRYGLVLREKSQPQSAPEPVQDPEPEQDPEPAEAKTEQHTAHSRRSRTKD